MRAEDIRRYAIEASQGALAESAKVREVGGPDIEREIIAYEGLAHQMIDFWTNVSPAFLHAWLAVVMKRSDP